MISAGSTPDGGGSRSVASGEVASFLEKHTWEEDGSPSSKGKNTAETVAETNYYVASSRGEEGLEGVVGGRSSTSIGLGGDGMGVLGLGETEGKVGRIWRRRWRENRLLGLVKVESLALYLLWPNV